MHVLFIHQNYPAQFGHIAGYLVRDHGFRCTFVSQNSPGFFDGIENIQYQPKSGATLQTHFFSRSFENAIWHSEAIFEALKARPDIQPDLVVAHSGFHSTVLLRELYACPIVNYFEYYYLTRDCDMDFRPDLPYPERNRLRARIRNATLLLDLEDCDLGYSPTQWQKSRFPALFQHKLRAIFDGIDTSLWQPREGVSLGVAGNMVSSATRLVTYVARGMESIRGFDIFMKFAKKLCARRPDVLCLALGQDRICYGGDEDFTGGKTFKEWVLAQDDYDLSRILFPGLISSLDLSKLFSITHLHVYLTVPFVLSWSLLNALACGAAVMASNTAPVREIITHGQNGILVDFFDIDGMVETACKVLDAPQEYKPLGQAGMELIRSKYSLDICLPQMLRLYEDALATRRPG
jgi:glycosyltransferase involved in cell wall biosynthesis